MASTMRTALAFAICLASARAQSITGMNWTASNADLLDNAIPMSVSMGNDMVPLAAVLPLTQRAGTDIPPPGLSGSIYLANASNLLNMQRDDVVLCSCDASDYPGNIGPISIFNNAVTANVTSFVWYTTAAQYCNGTGWMDSAVGYYEYIYTMKSANDSQRMLDDISILSGDNRGYITIGPVVDEAQNTNGSTPTPTNNNSPNASSTNQSSNPLGPSPSTAVAMIILYSITGIITALFLIIIITGAIRAHRHPERYGPRNILGRPRQSRARGLARAMLETIPIVKFGEREEPKPTDVELADAHAAGDGTAEQPGSTESSDSQGSGAAEAPGHNQRHQEDPNEVSEGGIAAATNSSREQVAPEIENQGCSICTEDFEIGQDQRVLPCGHRFHPPCIDPWLLNVSGTCPLCRIDLRPQTSHDSGEPVLDEAGNPVPTTEDGMAPPLAAVGSDAPRNSVRRSIIMGLMGIGRPDRMTREERVLALREYRGQMAAQAARRRREERDQGEQSGQESGAAEAPEVHQEEESGLRVRLRNAFRIRTLRRTDQGGEATPTQVGPSNEGVTGDTGARANT